jgi:hypothetical protein
VAKYTITYEEVIHREYHVEADSLEQAQLMFDNDEGTLEGSQESFNATDIELVED